MSSSLPTFPDYLRRHVAQVLRHHYESGHSRINLGAGVSVTGAVLERASMMSMRMHTCPVCRGDKVERIPRTNGTSIEVDCWRCIGQGEIGELRKRKVQEQTSKCRPCKGSGTIPRPEYRTAKMYDPHPDPCDRCNGRGYLYSASVMCGSAEYPHAQPTPGEVRSDVSDALNLMRERGQERSLLVLSIAYGEVGKHVERHLGLPAVVSLWPHTKHGKKLLEQLGSSTGKSPPWVQLHECLSGDWQSSMMANMANTGAIALLEVGLSHLAKADADSGGRVTAVAKRLEKETAK